MDTYADIADRFAVSLSSVERIARCKRERRDLKPGISTGRTPLISPEEHEAFERLASSRTDWTLQSLTEAWQAQSGTVLSLSTTRRVLERLRFTYKKRAASPASETKPSAKLSGTK